MKIDDIIKNWEESLSSTAIVPDDKEQEDVAMLAARFFKFVESEKIKVLKELQSKLAEAEKVIRFYADKKNWTPQGPIAEVVFNKPDGVVTVNFEDGVKAQEWLDKYKEEK